MRLLVISHTPHYIQDGALSAWGSTARELDRLASLFGELVHLAPLYSGAPPKSSLPYQNEAIRFVPVAPAGGDGIGEKLTILGQIPTWLAIMRREISAADAIHVRCPAGISMIGLIAQKIWGGGKPCWVKYAGNWKPTGREPLSYRTQRFWLSRNFHRGVVSVNGKWKDQPSHVVTFNNPSYSAAELSQVTSSSAKKELCFPLRLLFVGRVEEEKGIGRVIEIADGLLQRGVDFHLDIVGDGSAKMNALRSAAECGLRDRIKFVGWKSRVEIEEYYRIAHFILLPSASEGWPKVLSEAMAYGVVPLASSISSIPSVLSEAGSGQTIPFEEIDTYVNTIISYTQDRSRWKIESHNATIAAGAFTYEKYLDAVTKLFYGTWKVKIGN